MAILVIAFECERYCVIIHKGEMGIMDILKPMNKFAIKLNDHSINNDQFVVC